MRRYLLPLSMTLLTAGVLIGAWLMVELRRPQPPAEEPVQVRHAFDGTQPLALQIAADDPRLRAWLQDEMQFLLPRAPGVRYSHTTGAGAFLLKIESDDSSSARLDVSLIAPDGFLERHTRIALDSEARFERVSVVLSALPQFLGFDGDWRNLLGTTDSNAYETVTRARESLRLNNSTEAQRMTAVEQLERVTKQQSEYARAWATLSLLYLTVPSEDTRSLEALALQAAERALAIDSEIADAHAVRGWVRYRAAQWLTAYDDLAEALELQPASSFALHAMACLLVDAGLSREALTVAVRAIEASPTNIGAQECAAFAQLAAEEKLAVGAEPSFAVARLIGLQHFLAGDIDAGRKTYEQAARRDRIRTPWLNATASAIKDPSRTAEGLRALTYAESEGHIDPTTQMLVGLALKRREFVINRMQRLQRADEFLPLRVVWISAARSLRQHNQFDDLIRAAGLPAFWQTHGRPDVCETQSKLSICRN